MWPKKPRLLLILLMSSAVVTAPYWLAQLRLQILCTSCRAHGLLLHLSRFLAMNQEYYRLNGCLNDTKTIMEVFFGTSLQLNRDQPTYVRLQTPVSALSLQNLSPACLAVFTTPSTDHRMVRGQCFHRSYSVTDQTKVYPVLQRLEQNFTQRGLEIFLIGGSLLGSARHFGFIPWDDDVDFMIRAEQKTQVRDLLIDLSANNEFEFVDTEEINQHWKLQILCTVDKTEPMRPLYGSERLYPSKKCAIAIDLFFGSVFGNRYQRQERPFEFPLTDIYPLTRRPFGGYMLNAPGNAEAVLAAEYDPGYHTNCMFEIHSTRLSCSRRLLKCNQLHVFYPFVFRLQLKLPGGGLLDADVLSWRSTLQAIYIPQQ